MAREDAVPTSSQQARSSTPSLLTREDHPQHHAHASSGPYPGGSTTTAVDAGAAGGGERPYRSHLRPACQACRRRKSRCKVDEGDERGCLMCRVHGTECEFPSTAPNKDLTSPRRTAAAAARPPKRAQPHQPSGGGGTSTASKRRQLRARKDAPSSLPPAALGQTMSPARHLAQQARDDGDGAAAQQQQQHSAALIAGLGSPEEEESAHIVGPVVTSDTQVLADYLRADSSQIDGGGRRLARIVRVPGRNGTGAGAGGGGAGGLDNSVMFARVRRRPMGQTPNQTVASGKCQVIERIVEPWADELVDTYFRRANACFPLLDEGSFRDQFRRRGGGGGSGSSPSASASTSSSNSSLISPALLAAVYAHALTFWSQPRRAQGRHCPDGRFVWNQATDALYSELQLSPGMSTVIAVLLDVGGRPSTSMIGNGVLIGSAVSIAHGLGLHRDPGDWAGVSDAEKRVRVQIWWALVVHDKWFSLAYGTPPHIQARFHDVPRPRAADGNVVFLALVSLTEVLDAFLVHLYALKSDNRRGAASEFDPGAALCQWEESLSGESRRLVLQGKDLSIPGASNLRLAYLFVRLLQRRMELDRRRDDDEGQRAGADADPLPGRYVHLRRAAEAIVRLVQGLRASQLHDWWLPTTAFIFTSTMAFLLRVALETEKKNTAGSLAESVSLGLANDLLAALRGHQQNSGWDLGDVCIAQYADVVEELRRTTPSANVVGQAGAETAMPLMDWQDFDISSLPDVEELFPNLWDMFDSNH
ncbi:hypothetical protein Daus18300_009502 [Diaporthe australafricana]|uniref:Zn(2)-C6 fungal-type domain-containing protein n=1 Tax=Diaporthe australafricana TaxID=127596 RepID=A0ABR3WE02_9PEZI